MTRSSENRVGRPSGRARYHRTPGILERRVDDALFLVNPRDDSIFHLNALSAGLWRLLAEPISIPDAARIVQQAFPDTPPAQISEDVSNHIEKLQKAGLIMIAES